MNQTEEKIKFSVVLPIYNVEKYLNRCLDSVMNQTYKSLKLFLLMMALRIIAHKCVIIGQKLMIVLRLYIKKMLVWVRREILA